MEGVKSVQRSECIYSLITNSTLWKKWLPGPDSNRRPVD